MGNFGRAQRILKRMEDTEQICSGCRFGCESDEECVHGEIAALLGTITPPPRWRVEDGCMYWGVGDDGEVFRSVERAMSLDDSRYALGNYFRTREDAERAAEYVKIAFWEWQKEHYDD